MFDHIALAIYYASATPPESIRGYGMTFATRRSQGAHDDASFCDLIRGGARMPEAFGLSTSWQIFGLTYDDCVRL